jgi:hypothetical protein
LEVAIYGGGYQWRLIRKCYTFSTPRVRRRR